jgi:hypothetical protein
MNFPDTIEIGSRRELFVDRFLVDRLSAGAELRLGLPRPEGPALRFDRPWEGAFSGFGTVLRAGGRYLLYYRGWPDSKDHYCATTCVAESRDGLVFERPDLGLFEVCGTRENNVVLTCEEDMYAHNFAPFLDDRPGVPEDVRFKAVARNYGLFFLRRGERQDPMGLFAFASADGYRWRRLSDHPVVTRGKFDSQNIPFWSEHEGCYLCYLRETAGGEDYGRGAVRSIARCRSDDFLNWSEPELCDMGDSPPEELYTNATRPYFRAPHIYIALPGRFMPGRQVLGDGEAESFGVHLNLQGRGFWHDCSDAVLLTSRGGNSCDRTFMEALVRPGLDRRNWTSRCNYPACGIVQTGPEELSFYVERHNAQDGKFLERQSLRLDGFASLHAGYAGGELVTRPLSFSGSVLEINCATGAAGHIRIEIQAPDGQALPGYSLEDCPHVIGDQIARDVAWKEGTDVSGLAGQPVRLRFELKDADAYSFRVREAR